MFNRGRLLALGVVVALGASGGMGITRIQLADMRDAYLHAVDVCMVDAPSGAAMVAELDAKYSNFRRNLLPDDLMASARICALAEATNPVEPYQDEGT